MFLAKVGGASAACKPQKITAGICYLIPFLSCLQALAEELGEGAFTGTLAADSSNVVNLVETLYNVRGT